MSKKYLIGFILFIIQPWINLAGIEIFSALFKTWIVRSVFPVPLTFILLSLVLRCWVLDMIGILVFHSIVGIISVYCVEEFSVN